MDVKFGLLALRKECRLRVSQSGVLRMFGPKRDKEAEKLHNEELHNLYFLPSVIRTIKYRRMRWAEHIAHMGRRMHKEYWWESQKERDH
jgi:hypothetical protein